MSENDETEEESDLPTMDQLKVMHFMHLLEHPQYATKPWEFI